MPSEPKQVPPDRSRDPHHELNNPVGEPDPTEYPDPYEKREDPREDPGAHGATSTSEPHPTQDIEAGEKARAPERDNLDD
jgi:hypothetical protein